MKRVIITGGTGLIGGALASELARSGYEVILLSRNPNKARDLGPGIRVERWDARTAEGWGALADGATAIVNLAGESIGIPPLPWTAARKQRIRQTRLDAGQAVVEAVKQAREKPRVVVQASGVGYYGLHGDEVITEEKAAGKDFLAAVAVDWEASTARVQAMGVRHAIIRTGLLFSRQGGVLQYLALPFRFFAGGPLGSGKQWQPWIHMADEIGAICFLIENEKARGPFNLAAPNAVTNGALARVLGRVLRRPAFFPTPAFAMKLVLGELAELLLLGGQRAVPHKLTQLGYQFNFADLEAALRDLLT
ncbi:MAG: TIGR01777 family protein [Chloroflexi bacterium]|nr:TIGR01777 family protein [Chloroflexota bacterium]